MADTSESEENHFGEGSFMSIGQNSGQGNFENNAGQSAPHLPALPAPPSGLPALPAPPSGLPALPAPPSGLPALPAPPSGLPALPAPPSGLPALSDGLLPAMPGLPELPAPPSGLPTLVGGLPSETPDLLALLSSISTPFTLEAPLGLPTL